MTPYHIILAIEIYCMYKCICVCVRERPFVSTAKYTHIHTYKHMFILHICTYAWYVANTAHGTHGSMRLYPFLSNTPTFVKFIWRKFQFIEEICDCKYEEGKKNIIGKRKYIYIEKSEGIHMNGPWIYSWLKVDFSSEIEEHNCVSLFFF